MERCLGPSTLHPNQPFHPHHTLISPCQQPERCKRLKRPRPPEQTHCESVGGLGSADAGNTPLALRANNGGLQCKLTVRRLVFFCFLLFSIVSHILFFFSQLNQLLSSVSPRDGRFLIIARAAYLFKTCRQLRRTVGGSTPRCRWRMMSVPTNTPMWRPVRLGVGPCQCLLLLFSRHLSVRT